MRAPGEGGIVSVQRKMKADDVKSKYIEKAFWGKRVIASRA